MLSVGLSSRWGDAFFMLYVVSDCAGGHALYEPTYLKLHLFKWHLELPSLLYHMHSRMWKFFFISIKGIVQVFLKRGQIKYMSLVGLFSTVIASQRSLSLEKQMAAPAQTLSFVRQ